MPPTFEEACKRVEERRDDEMGHASAIVMDWEQGVLYAAADPRSDGAALGW